MKYILFFYLFYIIWASDIIGLKIMSILLLYIWLDDSDSNELEAKGYTIKDKKAYKDGKEYNLKETKEGKLEIDE